MTACCAVFTYSFRCAPSLCLRLDYIQETSRLSLSHQQPQAAQCDLVYAHPPSHNAGSRWGSRWAGRWASRWATRWASVQPTPSETPVAKSHVVRFLALICYSVREKRIAKLLSVVDGHGGKKRRVWPGRSLLVSIIDRLRG